MILPPETNVDSALRRAALLFRLLAVAWMVVMVVITLTTDPGASRSVVLGSMIVAIAGAAWSTRHLLSDRWLTDAFLVIDGLVALAVAFAPQLAGASDGFYGGYPMSWVVMVAVARDVGWGLGAAGLFSATQAVGLFTGSPAAPSPSDWISLTVMAGVVALVIGLGAEFLRTAEARRSRAEEELEAERRRHAVEEARLAERVTVADDLHDSLLQTVRVLAQHADDPERVRGLARRQERDLRGMIERMQGVGRPGAAAALRREAADVEDLHGVEIDVVASGDTEVDQSVAELVRAAREVMVNAARHSGAVRVDVTLEASAGRVAVVVRDRGQGFDADAAAGHGLASVRDRLGRLGGKVDVRTEPGEGTEVELVLIRQQT
ncbi:MAG TPA: ATP-binding protein [Acidimicrobiia bacterium]|nr:ATP-binding protein [Acidimicrobiia bacterium]